MKQLRSFFRDARRHQGLALIIVLSMLALATIVMLAFLSVADTEHKGTMGYSSSQTARRLADTAVNVVIAQIRAGSEHDQSFGGARSPTNWQMHATQPGAVRKYSQNGDFLAGYKLFSDSEMIYKGGGFANASSITDEYNFVSRSEPETNWNTGVNASRYVDLNEPVVKGVASASGNITNTQVFFPIIDPRAAYDMEPGAGQFPVEGFQYSGTTAINGNTLDTPDASNTTPIVLPPGNIDSLRLAMPVKWLYMLKDGTFGTLDTSLNFQAFGASRPSVDNPIIARVAFWTDDETCKLNINTASEPTFMGRPTYFHERDHLWADYPAAQGEYQRFSGHPATVALSSVLYPNPFQQSDRTLESYPASKSPASGPFQRILSVKNAVYDIVPRLNTGGSKAGSVVFATDEFSAGAETLRNVDLAAAMNERLYASMDELLFDDNASGGSRALNQTTIVGGNLFNKQTLERASAFLSAHSRASEISMLGLPRIAMWPIHRISENRTGFDNLIAFCSRLGPVGNGNLYIFQRENSRDATSDINNIPRNQALLGMLDQILGNVSFPGDTFLGEQGKTFRAKMANGQGFDNYRQVIVEMFDYIRSTNLYDSFLVDPDRGSWPTYVTNDSGDSVNWEQTYQRRDTILGTTKTFTVGIARNPNATTNGRGNNRRDDPFDDRTLPGHGQVTPIVWNAGGQNYRGFGRFVTISEIGLQFICTADGQPDMYSWRHLNYKGQNPIEGGDPNQKFHEFEITPVSKVREDRSGLEQASLPDLINLANSGVVSGGRTALRLDPAINGKYEVLHEVPRGFDANWRIVNSNGAGSEWWRDDDQPISQIKRRYYSNFPPLSNPTAMTEALYGTVSSTQIQDRGKATAFHPGAQPENWNHTLDQDTPLQTNQKRIQALLHLEFFCPSVGYTTVFPEFTVVLQGSELSGIEVGGQNPFNITGEVVIKSSQPLYQLDGAPQVGGYASFRRIASGRNLPGRGEMMPPDSGYQSGATGSIHGGLVNMDLVSNYFTVTSDQPLQFQSRNIRIDVYDTHDWRRKAPVQTIYFNMPQGRAPTPDLVVQPTHFEQWVDQNTGQRFTHPAVQAPHWWAFHRGGAIGRGSNFTNWIPGRLNEPRNINGADPNSFFSGAIIREGRDGDTAATGEVGRDEATRQRYPGTTALIYGFQRTGNYEHAKRHDNTTGDVPFSRIAYGPDVHGKPYNRLANHVGSDTVRTVQPASGDPRLIYAKTVVQATDWSPHPLYDSQFAFLAHNFSSYNAGSEAGFDRNGNESLQVQGVEDPTKRLLPQTIVVDSNHTPDAPYAGPNSGAYTNPTTRQLTPAFLSQRYYDFDDGDPGGRVGPYINKPDEGNFAVGDFRGSGWSQSVRWRSSYFRADSFGATFAAGARTFFTPNRMISSPVLMGSLPSRIHFGSPVGQDADKGGNGSWTNLLFRPHIQMNGGKLRHPGQFAPPDHYLLDLFWMPVVEPYAISEPLSTAGKVNMNYQMLPFTHIRRATALHAVMKGELFAALPNVDHSRARGVRRGFGNRGSALPRFHDETTSDGAPAAKWHRSIVVDRMNNESGAADSPWWVARAAGQRVVGTLRQFEERFNFGANEAGRGPSGVSGKPGDGSLPSQMRTGLFRTASQICEIHLIPSRINAGGNQPSRNVGNAPFQTTVLGANDPSRENVTAAQLDGYQDREDAMKNFWNNHAPTGDNTREAPYSNLYAKLTTRSNTFRVHVRAQTLKKALRGSNVLGFVPGEDEVTGEFRGSFLLERYIDTADLEAAGTAADYTTGNPMSATHPALDDYYRFRVIESKRFAP